MARIPYKTIIISLIVGLISESQQFIAPGFSVCILNGGTVSGSGGAFFCKGRYNPAHKRKRSWTHSFSLGVALYDDFENNNETSSEILRKVNNRYSASDWLHNMSTLRSSSILKEIGNPVLSVMAWATFVTSVQSVLSRSAWKFCRSFASGMCVGTQVHSLLVSSLGLLLVFRTNSAYQRFSEGRRIWEQILSVSRNLTRMLSIYEDEMGPDRCRRVKLLLAAFPYLLRYHIRPHYLHQMQLSKKIPKEFRLKLHDPSIEIVETRHEGDNTNGGSVHAEGAFRKKRYCWVDKREYPWRLLPKKAVEECARVRNRPLWACDRIGKELANISYGPMFTSRERLTMLRHLEKLSNAIGECERIHQTAVPLNYARHSLRSLTLWLFTLPFSLIKDFGFLTVPACGTIAWLMFGVYEIGYSIEDPFRKSLRLSNLCDIIRSDVLDESNCANGSSDPANHDQDVRLVATDKPIGNYTFGSIAPNISGLSIEHNLLQEIIPNELGWHYAGTTP